MIEVSVVVPAYNVARTIERTLDALTSQTFRSMEIVVINDGSKDDTAKVLDAYQQTHECIRVYHLPNQGVYRARLEGIARARGRYIGFCDADDLPYPDMYRSLYQAAEREKADMSACAYVREEMESGRILATEMTVFGDKAYDVSENVDILPIINTAQWNKLIRADIIKHAIDFEQPPRVLEDMMFLCSLYPHIGRIAFVKKPLYRYLVHEGSAMSTVVPEELVNLEHCMRMLRDAVTEKDARYAKVCDAMALIHFGVSVCLRRVQGGECASRVVREAKEYLDEFHPLWRKTGNSMLWNIRNRNLLLKPLIVRYCYTINLMRMLLWGYRIITETMRFDIKW